MNVKVDAQARADARRNPRIGFFVYHNMPPSGFLLIILTIIAHPAALLRHILNDLLIINCYERTN